MKAVVFDLDGTLIDSAPDLHTAANRMLNDLRRPPLTLENVAGFVGNGVPSLVARCLDGDRRAGEGFRLCRFQIS